MSTAEIVLNNAFDAYGLKQARIEEVLQTALVGVDKGCVGVSKDANSLLHKIVGAQKAACCHRKPAQERENIETIAYADRDAEDLVLATQVVVFIASLSEQMPETGFLWDQLKQAAARIEIMQVLSTGCNDLLDDLDIVMADGNRLTDAEKDIAVPKNFPSNVRAFAQNLQLLTQGEADAAAAFPDEELFAGKGVRAAFRALHDLPASAEDAAKDMTTPEARALAFKVAPYASRIVAYRKRLGAATEDALQELLDDSSAFVSFAATIVEAKGQCQARTAERIRQFVAEMPSGFFLETPLRDVFEKRFGALGIVFDSRDETTLGPNLPKPVAKTSFWPSLFRKG